MNEEFAESRSPVMGFMRVFKERATRSIRKRGLPGTLALVVSLTFRISWDRLLVSCDQAIAGLVPPRYGILSDPWARFLAERFDIEFGVTTAEFVDPSDQNPNTPLGNSYYPTPESVFHSMVSKIDTHLSQYE